MLFDEKIMKRRRGAEHIIRILFQQTDLVGKCTAAFAHGLPDRPQIAGVDMGVSQTNRGHGAGTGGAGKFRSQFRSRARRVFRFLRKAIRGAVDGRKNQIAPAGTGRQNLQ